MKNISVYFAFTKIKKYLTNIMENDWTTDIECVLENIRVNSVILSKEHKRRYFALKENLKYYRLPVIVLSGINSIVSVGLQPYLEQGAISMITCLLALVCSIIGSIELYLAIQKSMENELISQRDYYLLSVDIFKTLSLAKEHRPIPAKEYLDKCYNTYCKLIENSDTLAKRVEDKLCPLPINLVPPSPSVKLPESNSDIELGIITPTEKKNETKIGFQSYPSDQGMGNKAGLFPLRTPALLSAEDPCVPEN
jgi:hypothetical protein